MELTPQAINEVEFSMARRGYDPDQVDEFLEKVAVAIGEQQAAVAEARERVAAAEAKAADAERRAAERPERVVEVPVPAAPAPVAVAPSVVEHVTAAAEAELETLKRTLVLAQKTADAAVTEAKVEARRIVAAAEADARAAHEDTRRRLVEELGSLEGNRDSLRDDVRAIERHLDEQRLRIRGSVAELQRILDDPSRLKVANPPAAATAPEVAPPAVEPIVAARPAPEPVADPEPAPEPPVQAAPEPAPAAAPVVRARDDGDDEAWARFGPDEAPSGPPTQPVLRLDDMGKKGAVDPSDDAYLTELRKAMLDDTGAPDVGADGEDDPQGDRSRGRFGRRR